MRRRTITQILAAVLMVSALFSNETARGGDGEIVIPKRFLSFAQKKSTTRKTTTRKPTAGKSATRKKTTFNATSTRPSHQRSVVLLGDPRGSTQGTGFVISRKHGLIVTNSHVAELYYKRRRMTAMINGTRQAFTVKKLWFHPGVRRLLRHEKSMVIRSESPSDGPTAFGCPDIAVLQVDVSRNFLPAEMPIATTAELENLQEKEVRIYGYPMTDTRSWPKSGEIVRATYDKGTIRNTYNFQFSARSNSGENQFVQHSIPTIGGYSGSPLFLQNGHVVAVHNSTVTKFNRRMGHGIRIDCLWELAKHHKLTGMIPVPATARLSLARWYVQNPKASDYRKALKLVDEASDLIYNKQKYAAGVTKCNEALKLAKYSYAYRVRSGGYTSYWFDHKLRISSAEALKYAKLAALDAIQYLKVAPDKEQVDAVIHYCRTMNNLGHQTVDSKFNQMALNKLIELEQKRKNLSKYHRAQIHSSRGVALSNLGRLSEGLKEHNKAIELYPNKPVYYENRADYWRSHGYSSRAAADMAKARELRNRKKK